MSVIYFQIHNGFLKIATKVAKRDICCFFVQKDLQLSELVVLLQPILVWLQHLPGSQGAKRRIHHSKICPSP
jgi:hypothetical protein